MLISNVFEVDSAGDCLDLLALEDWTFDGCPFGAWGRRGGGRLTGLSALLCMALAEMSRSGRALECRLGFDLENLLISISTTKYIS
jgi:hypothetical protein